jgi:hypothetical protein
MTNRISATIIHPRPPLRIGEGVDGRITGGGGGNTGGGGGVAAGDGPAVGGGVKAGGGVVFSSIYPQRILILLVILILRKLTHPPTPGKSIRLPVLSLCTFRNQVFSN